MQLAILLKCYLNHVGLFLLLLCSTFSRILLCNISSQMKTHYFELASAATTFGLISNFYAISRGWEAAGAKVSDLLKFRAYFSFERRIDCFARKLGPVKPRFPEGVEKKWGGWGAG